MKKTVPALFLFSLCAVWCFCVGKADPLSESEDSIPYENSYIANTAEELEIATLEPVSKKPLSKEKETAVTIRCSSKNARVYLNKNYQGLTYLTVKNLRPGRYRLELQKDGFENTVHYIQVKPGIESEFFITLTELIVEEKEVN